MGADGPGLFADDTACDVRDAYREALAEGLDDAEAERAVLREFAEELSDPDGRVVALLALASVESTLGRLSEDVRRQALEVLAAGGDLDRWRDAGARDVRRRGAVLAKVRAQLAGPQPARRRIRPRATAKPTVDRGQVLGYRSSAGRMHLMRVVGYDADRREIFPYIRLLDYDGTDLPDPAQVAEIPVRTRRPPWKKVHIRIIDDDPVRRGAAGIFPVGSAPAGDGDVSGAVAMTWAELIGYLNSRDQLRTGSSPS